MKTNEEMRAKVHEYCVVTRGGNCTGGDHDCPLINSKLTKDGCYEWNEIARVPDKAVRRIYNALVEFGEIKDE